MRAPSSERGCGTSEAARDPHWGGVRWGSQCTAVTTGGIVVGTKTWMFIYSVYTMIHLLYMCFWFVLLCFMLFYVVFYVVLYVVLLVLFVSFLFASPTKGTCEVHGGRHPGSLPRRLGRVERLNQNKLIFSPYFTIYLWFFKWKKKRFSKIGGVKTWISLRWFVIFLLYKPFFRCLKQIQEKKWCSFSIESPLLTNQDESSFCHRWITKSFS